MKSLLTMGLALFVSSQAIAESVKLQGPFEIAAVKGHKGAKISGDMKLVFNDDTLVRIETHLSAPQFGKTDFLSKEIHLIPMAEAGFAVATLYAGVSHRFYLVWVGSLLGDRVTYQGHWYRVDQTADKIKKTLNAGWSGNPEGWLEVGVGRFAPPTL